MAETVHRTLDHTALKFNQASIIVLLLAGFLLDQHWLVAFVGAVMLVGTVWPRAGLFKLFYAQVMRPTGLLKPDPVVDEPQPHLFAQGVGGLFLAAASLAFLAGANLAGWLLAAVVVVLAAVNLLAGFCLGCFMYYHLARWGVHADLPWWQPARARQ